MSDFKKVTGYKAAQLVNKELEDAGLPTIPAQMIYNYVKEGYIPSELDGTKRLIDELELAKWATKYIASKQERLARAEAKAAK